MKLAFLYPFFLLSFHAVVVRPEVSHDFSNCDQFFYKKTPPQLEQHFDPKSICQWYQNQYHYATLYSTSLRIPLYSAYTLPEPCQGSQAHRMATWFVEPQLLPIYETMALKSMGLAGQQTSTYKNVQAINDDFRNTGYDRGHLNPNFYQCGDSRTATFTLTNAVPQDPCFNQQSWKKMEESSSRTMRALCSFPGAKRFFVTGIIRTRTRIPNRIHDKEEDSNRDYNRVTVPSHMWTAVCCDSSGTTNVDNGFSYAFIGKNTADSFVEILKVSELEAKLTANELEENRYQRVKIFADDCNENSEKSNRLRVLVSEPMDMKVANSVDDLSRVEQSSIPPKKRKVIKEAVGLIESKTIAAYDLSVVRVDIGISLLRDNTVLMDTRDRLRKEGADLLLFEPHDLTPISGSPHTELDLNVNTSSYGNYTASTNNKAVSRGRRRYLQVVDNQKEGGTKDQANSPVKDEYLVVPDISVADSDITIGGDRCRTSSCGFGQGTRYKWCYVDWSNNWEYCCTDKCVFRNGNSYPTCEVGNGKRPCSLRSSVITITGKRCAPGHECGLHNHHFYWCYTDTNKNWEKCCQPWHTCAKHRETKKFCFTGQSKETVKENCFY